MKTLLLVILLAHGGFWFGNTPNAIDVRWSAPAAQMPAAALTWTLSYETVTLARGQTDLAAEGPTSLTIKLPEVRALSDYAWRYELKEKATGKSLAQGQQIIHACPANLLGDTARRLRRSRSRLCLLERGDDLGNLLKAAGIEVKMLGSAADLQLQKPDLVLVGQDALPESEPAQRVLLDGARDGARVLVLAQKKARQALGIPLRNRALKSPLTWRTNHDIFDRLDAPALELWVRQQTSEVTALALPADAPVFELAFFSRETPGTDPAPIDALVATHPLGTGRILWWQLPVESWNDDPRSAILLGNALDYLLTPPEPTLPSSQRRTSAPDKTTPPATKGGIVSIGEQP